MAQFLGDYLYISFVSIISVGCYTKHPAFFLLCLLGLFLFYVYGLVGFEALGYFCGYLSYFCSLVFVVCARKQQLLYFCCCPFGLIR